MRQHWQGFMKCWNTPLLMLFLDLKKETLTPCWLEKWKIAMRSQRWGMQGMVREAWAAKRKKKKKDFLCSSACKGIWIKKEDKSELKESAFTETPEHCLMVITVLPLPMSKHFHGLLWVKHVVGALKSFLLRQVVQFTSEFIAQEKRLTYT